MNLLFIYFLKSAISLALFYTFYWFFLRKETFFGFNRYYFLGSMFFSFLMPLIDVGKILPSGEAVPVRTISESYVSFQNAVISPVVSAVPVNEVHNSGLSAGDYFLMIYLTGVVILLLRLIVQVVVLTVRIKSTKVINVSDAKVVVHKKVKSPFSFFNYVFISQEQMDEKNIGDVILHEKEHINQKHSIDLLFAELLTILQWPNPFAWLTKKSLIETHEYLADSAVLKNGVPVDEYQRTLISYMLGAGNPALVTPFNFSLNKKRLIMMNKIKSPALRKWRSILLLPLLAVLLIAFSNPDKKEEMSFLKVKAAEVSAKDTSIVSKLNDNLLIFLDGKEISQEEMKKIPPYDIKKVNVVKGKNAEKLGGDGKAGVILITTKQSGKKEEMAFLKSKTAGMSAKDTSIVSKLNNNLLIFLDGKEISQEKMKKISHNDIKEVTVLKGKNAEELGGDGKAGVILINTKKSEEHTISGTVVDDKTGQPIRGVSIIVYGTTTGTITDANGRFSLNTDKIYAYISFSFVGYKTVIKNIKTDAAFDIRLKKAITVISFDKLPEVKEYEKPAQPVRPDKAQKSDKPVFFVVEAMPEFPGGITALHDYIASNTKYPSKAKRQKISGTVFVNFTVDKNGKVTDVYIDKNKSVNPLLDKEAVRVVSGMPDWKPGAQRNWPVPVQMSVPVKFEL